MGQWQGRTHNQSTAYSHHFLVDVSAEVEGVDTGVSELVGEEGGRSGHLGLGLHQGSESSIVKLVVGVVEVIPVMQISCECKIKKLNNTESLLSMNNIEICLTTA